jgi:hypothetical protein
MRSDFNAPGAVNSRTLRSTNVSFGIVDLTHLGRRRRAVRDQHAMVGDRAPTCPDIASMDQRRALRQRPPEAPSTLEPAADASRYHAVLTEVRNTDRRMC